MTMRWPLGAFEFGWFMDEKPPQGVPPDDVWTDLKVAIGRAETDDVAKLHRALTKVLVLCEPHDNHIPKLICDRCRESATAGKCQSVVEGHGLVGVYCDACLSEKKGGEVK